MARELVIGAYYRHFKNKLYKVLDIVYHSETKEAMVLYQALYGDFKSYVRPLDMFLSEVDHVKYPEVKAKYRFSRVSLDSEGNVSPIDEDASDYSKAVDLTRGNLEEKGQESSVNKEASFKERQSNIAEVKESESKEDRIASLVEQFLDSKDYADKLDCLLRLRTNINDNLIDLFAESLDIVVDKGDLDTRFKSLKSVLEAHSKYEGARLRR